MVPLNPPIPITKRNRLEDLLAFHQTGPEVCVHGWLAFASCKKRNMRVVITTENAGCLAVSGPEIEPDTRRVVLIFFR